MLQTSEESYPAASAGHGIRPGDTSGAPNDPKTYVTFDISGQTFGVEVSFVREILDKIDISRVPHNNPDICGIIDIRDESVPVMDIGCRLGMQNLELGPETRIIVFEARTGTRAKPIGVLADRVRDVTQIQAASIESPPDAIGGAHGGGVLSGLARHSQLLIAILDIRAILGDVLLDGDLQ